MSEYTYYLHALRRQLPVWLLVSVVASGLVYGALSRRGPVYTVHFSYLVSLAEREQASAYTFDGFYALQATDLFTTTLAGWLTTPELIVAAYHEAGMTLPTNDARKLRRSVEATKTGPQLIEVKVTGRGREDAERLSAALATVTEHNVRLYHNEGIPAVAFRVVATDSWTGVSEQNVALVAISVLVVTLVLLVNLQLVWEAQSRAGRH